MATGSLCTTGPDMDAGNHIDHCGKHRCTRTNDHSVRMGTVSASISIPANMLATTIKTCTTSCFVQPLFGRSFGHLPFPHTLSCSMIQQHCNDGLVTRPSLKCCWIIEQESACIGHTLEHQSCMGIAHLMGGFLHTTTWSSMSWATSLLPKWHTTLCGIEWAINEAPTPMIVSYCITCTTNPPYSRSEVGNGSVKLSSRVRLGRASALLAPILTSKSSIFPGEPTCPTCERQPAMHTARSRNPGMPPGGARRAPSIPHGSMTDTWKCRGVWANNGQVACPIPMLAPNIWEICDLAAVISHQHDISLSLLSGGGFCCGFPPAIRRPPGLRNQHAAFVGSRWPPAKHACSPQCTRRGRSGPDRTRALKCLTLRRTMRAVRALVPTVRSDMQQRLHMHGGSTNRKDVRSPMPKSDTKCEGSERRFYRQAPWTKTLIESILGNTCLPPSHDSPPPTQ